MNSVFVKTGSGPVAIRMRTSSLMSIEVRNRVNFIGVDSIKQYSDSEHIRSSCRFRARVIWLAYRFGRSRAVRKDL